MLSPMKGTAPTKSEIERRLMLADDLPGVEIGKVRFVREEERGVLIVPATRNKFAGRANIANRGTSELGPVRMQLRSVEHTSELQSLMRLSYDVFGLRKKTQEQTIV